MKKYTYKSILILIFSMMISAANAEIIYLKDGQIIKGDIIKEDSAFITVKTKYQVKRINRIYISRILYGERDLEEINILMNDGSTISGFLIDQDNKQVIIRKDKKSSKETTLLKSNIKQMSPKKIIPLQPDFTFRAGFFQPVSSNGAKLKSSLIFTGSIGFNLPIVDNLRFFLEGGYTKSSGKANSGLYLQIIPISININYGFPISYFFIVPRTGIGIAVVEFFDGEKTNVKGYDFVFFGGLGFEYELISKTLRIGLYCDYMLLKEKNASLSNMAFSLGLSYRL